MNKKRLLFRTPLDALFLLFGTALSACSSTATNVISSLSSAQKYFDAHKSELIKKNVINLLKEGYSTDSKATVNSLFAGWKYTLMDQKILERNLDASRFTKAFGTNKGKDDVIPSISEKGLFLDETYSGVSQQIAKVLGVQSQKVTGFSYSWSSTTNFKIVISFMMQGIVGSGEESNSLIKSFLSSGNNGNVTENDFNNGNANFDGTFIFTFTPPTDGRRFAFSNFDPITGTINFPANLQIDASTTHEKLNILMQNNEHVKKIKSRSFTGKSFDLLPFYFYALL